MKKSDSKQVKPVIKVKPTPASGSILVEAEEAKPKPQPVKAKKVVIQEARASLKFLRMSPKKVKLVIDELRGLKVTEAFNRLLLINKRAVGPVFKLLSSAVANAEHNFKLNKDNLYIKEIRADGGPALKRWRPVAFGRANPIKKRSSHIFIVLAVKDFSKAKKVKVKKTTK